MQLQHNRAMLVLLLVAANLSFHEPFVRAADPGSKNSKSKSSPKRNLDSLLEPILKKHGVPALAAAVISDNRIVAIGAVGVRKAGTDVRVTIDDQFHLGSCTKAMTATLIGVLVDEGKLRWDMTLAEALPMFSDEMHDDYRKATLDNLLHHRAGLPPNEPPGMTMRDLHALKGSPTEQRQKYTKALLSAKPLVEPDTRFAYSNAGYAVAGFIAEHATGKSWEDLMHQRVFRPLGIKTAGFGAMGKPGKIEQPWQHVMVSGKLSPIEPGPMSDNPIVSSPAGRVHCCIEDWAKFVVLHVDPVGANLLKRDTLRKLHTPTPNGEDAAGWMVVSRPWGGGKVLTHGGSNTMNHCVAWIAPKRGFAVLAATNLGSRSAFLACDETASVMIRKYLLGK